MVGLFLLLLLFFWNRVSVCRSGWNTLCSRGCLSPYLPVSTSQMPASQLSNQCCVVLEIEPGDSCMLATQLPPLNPSQHSPLCHGSRCLSLHTPLKVLFSSVPSCLPLWWDPAKSLILVVVPPSLSDSFLPHFWFILYRTNKTQHLACSNCLFSRLGLLLAWEKRKRNYLCLSHSPVF